jgi:HlyD family secretion protein
MVNFLGERMKRLAVAVIVLATVAAATWAWWRTKRERDGAPLALYGNIDLRQVQLPFNNNQRIAEVLVQEGDRVQKGQVLARLDTGRLKPQVAQAEAQVEAQRQVVERLHNGSRPEEIAEARANVESAKADLANARSLYARLTSLSERSKGGAVSQQDLDNAKAALDVAEARTVVNQKALELLVAGPRREDIAEAEARLRANEAQLALLKQEWIDAELVAPVNAVVRTRIMEPGEMASPLRPVFLLAIIDPKWVRAYVSERDLSKVRPGLTTRVSVDSFPDRDFEGWIGFVSPVAEFTPKTVQTEELRTSLVYEVRVFVKDPLDQLRLGMPATVRLDNGQVDATKVTRAPHQPAATHAETEAGDAR